MTLALWVIAFLLFLIEIDLSNIIKSIDDLRQNKKQKSEKGEEE